MKKIWVNLHQMSVDCGMKTFDNEDLAIKAGHFDIFENNETLYVFELKAVLEPDMSVKETKVNERS